jgi:micrococcal nuclease
MKRYRKVIVLLLILPACVLPLTIATPDPGVTSCLPQNTTREAGQVVNVIDGDTIDVRIGGLEYRVRYIGIDTPELDEPYYDQASEQNRFLVEGRQVTLIKDVSEKDQYDRLLRYVLIDEVFVNYDLVHQGYAVAVTFPPDVACSDTLLEAEQLARLEERGLWGKLP